MQRIRDSRATVPENGVDLWLADLDADEYSEETAIACLSADERDRAQRFLSSVHRRRYIVRRAILRTLLSGYLEIEPRSVSFSYGPNRKPLLHGHELHFNVSHTDSQACFAFSSGTPLGVDIERVRPMPDLLEIAREFCSPTELEVLKSLSAEEQSRAFFRCWTMKEALVKALGYGLSYPLDQITISLDEPARLLDVRPDQEELLSWHLHSWEAEPDCLGALVSRFRDCQIIVHRFQGKLS